MTEIELSHQANPRWKDPFSSVLSLLHQWLTNHYSFRGNGRKHERLQAAHIDPEDGREKWATASLVADNEPSVDGAFYQTLTPFSSQKNKEQRRWLRSVENLIGFTPNRLWQELKNALLSIAAHFIEL